MKGNANVTSPGGMLDRATRAGGFVANQLMSKGFKAASLRTNDVLRKDEWKQYDETVVQIARQRLNGVADLFAQGLTYPLNNAMGKTIVEWEEISDMDPAQRSMDGVTRGTRDRLQFNLTGIPVFITHRDFHISLRVLEASRTTGDPLDTTTAATAARLVADSLEDSLFNGSNVVSGGQTAYGYTNFPTRTTGNFETTGDDWDAAIKTGEQILADVLNMISDAHADNMFGPYMLYVPSTYWMPLQDDFKANSDRTVIERIRAIDGIIDVKPADVLTAHNVVLVQMTSDVVDVVDGEAIQTVQWDSEGGFLLNFKVMAIQVPRIKNDYDNRCGIVHYTNTP